jgi:tripartite-type tricarboxylate transporter receptor subunit TctC
LSIGNEGPRTFGGVIARLFNARTKADANLVSYASVSVSLQDLMGGHVDAVVADVASSAQLVKQGRLRLLAVTSSKRVPGFDSVPTLNEGVMPGLEMVGWFALVAPTGTPQPVIERVNRDLNALLADRDVAERIAAIGPIADASMSPEATNAFLRAERARWGEISKEIGLLPE